MFLSCCRRRGLNHNNLRFLAGSLQDKMTYNYINKKKLDEIEREHGTSTSQKLKMYSKQAQLIYKQGWQALKLDYKTYVSLKQKEKEGNSTLTHEEVTLKKRMWQQLQGIKTLIIIQILPFSGPLLIYYIYVYPTSIPSWFSVDAIHDNYQLQCIKAQAKAIQLFQEEPLRRQNFKLNLLNNEELKRLSELLFGQYEDGLTGYNKIRPENKKQYLIHPVVSKHLMIRNIKKGFSKEQHLNPDLNSKTIEELVLQKYDRIMEGGERIKFEPVSKESEDVADEDLDETAEKEDKNK